MLELPRQAVCDLLHVQQIFHAPLFGPILSLLQCLIISLVNGVGLFVFLVPFLLRASFVPLYRKAFLKVLRLPADCPPAP